MNPLPFIAWCFLIASPPTLLVWLVYLWWRTSPRIDMPVWRSYVTIGAIFFVGLSQLLWFVLGIWLNVGGERVYGTVFMRLAWLGLLTTLGGILASLLSKRTLRWQTLGLAVLMMFLWFAMGLGSSDL
jgi:hypothetical protein